MSSKAVAPAVATAKIRTGGQDPEAAAPSDESSKHIQLYFQENQESEGALQAVLNWVSHKERVGPRTSVIVGERCIRAATCKKTRCVCVPSDKLSAVSGQLLCPNGRRRASMHRRLPNGLQNGESSNACGAIYFLMQVASCYGIEALGMSPRAGKVHLLGMSSGLDPGSDAVMDKLACN